MSFRLRLLAVTAALVLVSGPSPAQIPTLKSAMRGKLINAQQALEAVVGADYVSMARFANALSRITETEIASWQVGAHPVYREQAILFLSSVRGLREAAAKRDLDAALAHYTALVSSCTRCHAHVRSARTISFEVPPVR